MNEMLSGSSCVKYILEDQKNLSARFNLKMNWISELAVALFNNDITNIELKCFNSNLYDDFINNEKVDLNFSGFAFLNEVRIKKIKLTEEKLNYESLKNELENSNYIILAVAADLFYNDPIMTGGHFIILKEVIGDKIKIINPINGNYEIKEEFITNLLRCSKKVGSWRLLVKK